MKWKFYLVDYTTDANGITTLVDEPNGWNQVATKLTRDENTHGLFFDFIANNLTFYFDGADILEAAYSANGIEAKVNLLVQVKCSDTSDYDDYYEGKILFATYKSIQSKACSVTVNVEQTDSQMVFKNRMETPVDLTKNKDIDDNTLATYDALPFDLTLKAKGIFKQTDRYSCADYDSDIQCYDGYVSGCATCTDLEDVDYWKYYGMDFSCVNKDEVNTWTGLDTASDDLLDVSPNAVAQEGGVYNIEINASGTAYAWALSLTKCLNFASSSGHSQHVYGFNDLWLEIHLLAGTNDVTLFSAHTNTLCIDPYDPTDYCGDFLPNGLSVLAPTHDVSVNPNIPFSFTYSGTFNLLENDEVKLYFKIHQQGQYHRNLSKEPFVFMQELLVDNNSIFKINFISYFQDTTTKAFAINESLSRITEAITNDEIRVKSDYFGRTDSAPYTSTDDGCGALEIITKGLMIRNATISNQPNTLAISFAQLFSGLNAIHCIGMGFEPDTSRTGKQWLRIEPIEYFYNSNIIFSATKINKIERNVLTSRIHNKFKFGYKKYEAEENTGLDEFLTEREYSNAITQTNSTFEKLSDLVASGYAMEVTRRKSNTDTKDWRYDNDTFIICCKRDDGSIVVEQGNIASDSNIIDPPTIYNFRISPLRNALRWFKVWATSFKNFSSSTFKFANGKGNVYAEGLLTDGCIIEDTAIAENQTIDTSTAADVDDIKPLWFPEEVQFEYPVSYDEWLQIKANPNGLVEFQHMDEPLEYGYIMALEHKPNDGKANFTLLKAVE